MTMAEPAEQDYMIDRVAIGQTATVGEETRPFVYPNYEFNVSGMHLFKTESDIFDISDDTRLSRTLAKVQEVTPSFDELIGQRKKTITTQKSFLSTKTSLMQGNTIEQKRSEIIDRKQAVLQTLNELSSRNHPAVQLLEMIEIVYNLSGEFEAEMNALRYGVVSVLAWPELKKNYLKQIAEAKQKLKNQLFGSSAVANELDPSA